MVEKVENLRNENYENHDHPRLELLREKALDYFKKNSNEIDENDLILLKENNFWINRFLNFKSQSFENAFDHLVDTFKWRKENKISQMDISIIPLEAWLSGAIFCYLPDKFGNPIMYLRASLHHKIEEPYYTIFKKFILYFIDQLDSLANKEFGWSIVVDLCNLSWSNVDLEMVYFLLNNSRMRYPNGCRQVIVHGLPWFLNILAKGVMNALPKDTAAKIKFVSGSNYPVLNLEKLIDQNNNMNLDETKQKNTNEKLDSKKLPIEEYIDIENLPDFIGGNATVNYKRAYNKAETVYEIGKKHFNLDNKKIKTLIKPFNKLMEDSLRTYNKFIEKKFSFEFNTIKEERMHIKNICKIK